MDKLMKLIQLEKLVCTMSTISHRLTGHLSNFFSQHSDTVECVPINVLGIEDTYLKSELEPVPEFIHADFVLAEYISAIAPKRG
jgi:hypothetical protein